MEEERYKWDGVTGRNVVVEHVSVLRRKLGGGVVRTSSVFTCCDADGARGHAARQR